MWYSSRFCRHNNCIRLGLGQPTAGISYELDAVAAVIIGSASLSEG